MTSIRFGQIIPDTKKIAPTMESLMENSFPSQRRYQIDAKGVDKSIGTYSAAVQEISDNEFLATFKIKDGDTVAFTMTDYPGVTQFGPRILNGEQVKGKSYTYTNLVDDVLIDDAIELKKSLKSLF